METLCFSDSDVDYSPISQDTHDLASDVPDDPADDQQQYYSGVEIDLRSKKDSQD
jgi:hypothetical protein